MKKRVLPLSPKGTGVIKLINQNTTLLIMTFCFIIGFLSGVLIFKYKNANGGYYALEFLEVYKGLKGSFADKLSFSFSKILPYAAAIFLSGTCMVGAVIVPAAVMLRGAVLGLVMSYAYSSFGLMGIVFNCLILIPAAVISTIALVLSAREALGFSVSIARLALPSIKPPELEQDFKFYCLRQLFVFLFFCVSALVQAVMASSFISFFNM